MAVRGSIPRPTKSASRRHDDFILVRAVRDGIGSQLACLEGPPMSHAAQLTNLLLYNIVS